MVDGYSDLDGEVSTTTVLPAPQNPSATVNTDRITLSADAIADADGYRFYRAQSSGSVLGDYTQISDEPTPTYDDTAVEDGEKYYYVVTAYTQDTESDPSVEVNAVAFLPAPGVALSENSPNGVLVEWTKEDNSTDGGWRIDRREDGLTAWTTIATPVLSDRSYTDTAVAAGTYDYRVVRETDHDPDAETTQSITIGVAALEQGLVVGEGTNAVQFGPSELIAWDIERIPTGVGTARIDVPETDALIPNVQRQDRLDYYVQGDCRFTGYAVGFSGNDRSGKWTLRADGIGKRLEETRPDYQSLGGSLVYSNIALDEALGDYWARTPFNASVTPQDENIIASNELLQSADTTSEWSGVITPPDTLPLTVQNGALTLQQSCWTTEGENETSSSGSTTFGNPQYSSGFARGFSASGSTTGSYLEWEFTPEYTIPSEYVGVKVRDNADDTAGVTWTLNGNTIDSLPQAATGLRVNWSDIGAGKYDGSGYTGGDLEAGTTYTLRVEVTGISSGETYEVDVVAPYDTRYSYTFDNDNGGSSGYLDGPELYPASVTAELTAAETAYNISQSDVSITIDDTSGGQAIAVSNDGGTSYTSFSNTSTVTYAYSGSGRSARVKLTLSRYGSRSTATPQQGYQGQSIDSYTHSVDLTDLTVIDELELSRNHFDNLKQLHNYGSYEYSITHDDNADLATLTVESFPRGAITDTTPDAFQNPENRSPEVAAETYFNSIYLQGRLRADGTRPTAEVKDQQAITEDGREISPGVLRDPSIGTDAGATFRANALLQDALGKDVLRGRITSYPVDAQVGHSYTLDFGNGLAERVLERVKIRESAGELTATYEFVVREALAETLNELKQNSRDISDQV